MAAYKIAKLWRDHMRAFASTVLRFFLTGVAAILPLIVTVFVVTWVVKLADAYVGPSSSFGRFIVTLAGENQKYFGYLSGYLVVILLIMLLGFLVTRATLSRVQHEIDAMVARIPLIGKLYTGVSQVVDLLGGKDRRGLERFGGVGEVKLGNVSVLALLTTNQRYKMADNREYFLVFVPNSPIPATGFNILVPVEDFHPLDMAFDDFAKIFVSLGLLGPQVLRKA
jgi:uncharacterized membrane protein